MIENESRLVTTLPQDSWLRDFMTCFPVSEPPRAYLLYSALSFLGACLGRRVYFLDDTRKTWPMLNLLLIGPSGVGKSSSIEFVHGALMETLSKAERPQVLGPTTPEKLHKDLVVNPHSILVASELAAVFTKQKYMEGMIPYVTRLLDYPSELVRSTVGSSTEIIKEPSVTVVGGSTRDWLQEQLPDTAASGGFLARFLIVKEDHKFQRIANPKTMLSKTQWAKLDELRTRTFAKFPDLLKVSGEIGFKDFSASDAFGLWYQCHTPETGYLSPFSARSREMVPRLSMLIAVSCGRMQIHECDVNSAIQLFEYCMGKLQEVLVPVTQQGKMLANVLQMLTSSTMSPWEIKRAMRNSMGAQDVERVLQSLIESHDVVRLPDGRYQRATR